MMKTLISSSLVVTMLCAPALADAPSSHGRTVPGDADALRRVQLLPVVVAKSTARPSPRCST